jgi:hypothetical protein
MTERAVPGFLPSRHGFHFANRWPPGPAFWLGAGYVRIGFGNVADGLCGGMGFAVRDRFEAGLAVPGDAVPPAAGTPLFAEIVRRQVDSFDRLVRLPFRFWSLAALHPDRPTRLSRVLGLAPRGTLAVRDEWPRLRAEIEAGRLAMVGLVRSAGRSPFSLGQNHQVLAWGYRVAGQELAIRIYDPNWPDRDDVEVMVRLDAEPETGRQLVTFGQSTGEPLLGWFLAPFIPARRGGR